MSASAAIRDFVAALLPAWRVQFGRWEDDSQSDRYVVIKPAGGPPAELVRRPAYTLIFIGAAGDAPMLAHDAANQVIEAMRASSGSLVFMQAGEPVPSSTDDGRSTSEIAVSTITN